MQDTPFTMRLCGMDVAVNFTEPGNWQQSGMGRSNSLRGEIELSSKLTDATRAATFLHEIVHLILDSHGYCQESNKEGLVNALSLALLAWMRDNQELVDQISRA